MKRLLSIRERLAWKLFLSYLVILLVAIVVLDLTAELQSPSTLARDITRLQALLKENPSLASDLQENFHVAVNEILAVGTLVATFAAVLISLFTARRIVQPIRAMMKASQHIAAGDYRERVPLASHDELGALAQSFNQMAEALEQTEQRRMELVGDVAHELRTPLASIQSSMEGLVDGVLPAEAETFLDIEREVARLQRLVSGLTELSKAEAGVIPLELVPVAPCDLIQSAADRLSSQFQDKGVRLDLQVSSNLPRVQADSGRMTQVLLNLLGNALQYTPPGGQVTVRAWAGQGECYFSIRDTGAGIAPEHLPHVFERFYRADKSRSRAGGGSGIGLTIARHLVTAHKGRLWAASAGAGCGSTFTFTLPLSA
ncbi:MAG: sensor histidine kinase [Acidobacteriota bacterium]